MSRQVDNWQTLAAAARKAGPAAAASAAVSPAWAASVAQQGMAAAALQPPTLLARWLAQLRRPAVGGTAGVILVSGLLWLGPSLRPQYRAEVRYENWAHESLRQLRTWLPLECEQSGQIGLILRDTVDDLRKTPRRSTNVIWILTSTEQRISALLTPEQQTQFRATQEQLRTKWFP